MAAASWMLGGAAGSKAPLGQQLPSFFLGCEDHTRRRMLPAPASPSAVAPPPVEDWRLVAVLPARRLVSAVVDLEMVTVIRRFSALPLCQRGWTAVFEILIDKGVTGCQSFALIGVAGSLVGSVLCFLEGCFAVAESFFSYFCSMPVDQGAIMKLVIEALDMYLFGSAVLAFGMGLYTMFAGPGKMAIAGVAPRLAAGSFCIKRLKQATGMRCVSEAKSRMGHAVLLLLQAGVIDKFKSVPMATGLDMACFAGAVLAASAAVFLLSRLKLQNKPHLN